MVHRKTYTPLIKFITLVIELVGEEIAGTLGPLTSVHVPVPLAGLFPLRVADVALHKL